MLQCPKCGIPNPDDAARCSCGIVLPEAPDPLRGSGRRIAISLVLGLVSAVYWPTMLYKVMHASGRYGNEFAALLFLAIPPMLILAILGTALSITVLRIRHDRRAGLGVIANGIIPLAVVAFGLLMYWFD